MKNERLFTNLIISLLLLSFSSISAQVIADFEGVTKGAYATGTVTMNGYNWELTEVVISSPSSASDWKIDDRSARFRGYANSELVLLTEKPDGIGSITFQYRRFGTDPQVDWKVEYTLDDGLTWFQAGDDFTAPTTDDITTFYAKVNMSGDVRMRIVRATDDENSKDRRLNVDNISITNYNPSLTGFSVAGGPIFYPNDELKFTWIAVDVEEIRFEMQFADETEWQPAEGLEVVDATLGAFNFNLPLDVNSETIHLRIVDNSNSSVVSNVLSLQLVDNVFAGPYLASDLYPKDNAIDVPIDLYNFMSGIDSNENPWAWSSKHDIVIEFHEEIALNTGNITISKQGEGSPIYIFDVATAENIHVDWETLRITLPEILDPHTTYEVVVDAEAFADKEEPIPNLSDEIAWSFTTGNRQGSDFFTGLAPWEEIHPSENETGVYTDLYIYRSGVDHEDLFWEWESERNIILVFVDEIVKNVGSITISKQGEPTPIYSFDVAIDPAISIEGNSLRVGLPKNLSPNTTYEVVIPSGAIVDNSTPTANEWEGLTWSFTTAQGIGGKFSPQFNPGFTLYPTNGAVDLPTDLFLYHEEWDDFFFNTILLNLDADIAKGSGHIIVTNLAESEPIYTIDMASEDIRIHNNSVIVLLPDKLDPNTSYKIEVEAGTIIDAELPVNSWAGITWSFTTGNRDSYKTIYEIRDQKKEPAFIGQFVPTSGVVTKKGTSGTLFLQDADSQGWSGLLVNDANFVNTATEEGEYNLVGKVGFENDMAQLSDIRVSHMINTSQSFTPKIIELPFAEEFLSMLVKIKNVSAVDVPGATQEFWVTDGDKIGLISKLWYSHPAEKDQGFSSITGVLHRSLGQNKLAPRDADDLVAVVVSAKATKSTKLLVSLDPASDILNISAPTEIEFVELVSIVGESLLKENGSNRTNIPISTVRLSQGVYIVKIVLKNSETFVVKIIKK